MPHEKPLQLGTYLNLKSHFKLGKYRKFQFGKLTYLPISQTWRRDKKNLPFCQFPKHV